jgi:hypothetical protein
MRPRGVSLPSLLLTLLSPVAYGFAVVPLTRIRAVDATLVPQSRAASSCMQSQDNNPDTFIPIFVAVALGGYCLILVVDAIQHGVCLPGGACFGVAQPTGWGS